MKKLCLMLLAALLLLPLTGLAETLEPGAMLEITDGQSIDLDGDGSAEAIHFTCTEDEEGTGSFVLSVGGFGMSGDGYALTGKLYALRLAQGFRDTLLLVPEQGPSDDDACYAFLYEDEALHQAGVLPSAAQDISVNGSVISCVVRGNVLQTWFRPADYGVAHSFAESPDFSILYEIPRAHYPMGTLVTLKMDLPVYKSPTFFEELFTLKTGDKAVLASTDDASFLYIKPLSPLETDNYYDPDAGYVPIGGLDVYVNGTPHYGADVFDGLLFAD